MKLSLRPLKRLHWEMMFPYILSIPLVMLLIQIVVILASIVIIELFLMPSLTLYSLQQATIQARPFFVHNGEPDQQALADWIQNPDPYNFYQPGIYAVTDARGKLIAQKGSSKLPLNTALQTHVSSSTTDQLQQVLVGQKDNQGVAFQNADGSVIAIAPIRNQQQEVVGALFTDSGPNLAGRETSYWISYYAPTLLISTLFFAAYALVIGIIGSHYTSRKYTRRFRKMSQAVGPWSQGDFSNFIQDKSGDEIGLFAQQLNVLGEQLQNLLKTRQRLATMEERNRLARDLHDSVKQHIFIANLQVGAARLQLGEREEGARQRLGETEEILQQVQQELGVLIQELRSVSQEEQDFTTTLQALVTQWERQSSIATSLQIEGEGMKSLPPQLEEALYRITQEALANVVRHSKATAVSVGFVNTPDQLTLTITDNGQGFNQNTKQNGGLGLTSMQERGAAIGGEVQIESAVGTGTSVIVSYKRQASVV